MGRGGIGHAFPREDLVVGGRGGAGDVHHDGAAELELLDERVLEVDQPGGRMDDLDPDRGLAEGPVQQPADLEAADPERSRPGPGSGSSGVDCAARSIRRSRRAGSAWREIAWLNMALKCADTCSCVAEGTLGDAACQEGPWVGRGAPCD